MDIKNNILETIGHTPLIRLNKLTRELPCPVLAKVEYFNPGNSAKDRMALKMVEVAEKDGRLQPGGTIIECTSGNTGMGLALAAVVKGYKCIFTTTDKQSKEKIDILKALGAEVIVCPTNVEPDDPRSYYSIARRLAKEIPNSFHANQYDNLANRLAHYETTGPEIWDQTDGKVTHLVVATGTGGTVTGTAMYLKEKNPNVQVWAMDPFGSLLTKYFRTGGELDMNQVHPYITEGIGEDFVPQNYDMQHIDQFEQVSDKDAAIMARRIAREEGLFCGYSAGTAVQGLMQLKHQLTKDDLVVVILHDHGSRYVGKIYNDQWMIERGFLAVKTFKDIIAGRGAKRLITASPENTVAETFELMQKYHIENLPVLKGGELVGAISESGLFSRLMSNGTDIKGRRIGEMLEKPYPIVSFDTPLERLSTLITKENGAVLGKDDSNNYHIVTKYDLIQALGA